MTEPPPKEPPPSSAAEDSGLISIRDFSAIFGISVRSVFTLFNQGLPKVKMPGLGVKIPTDEARAWLLAGGRKMSSSPLPKPKESLTISSPKDPLVQPTLSINTSRAMKKSNSKSYSLSYNEKRQVWIAQVRRPDGTGWHTKYLSKSLKEHQQIDAEAELFNWLPGYLKTGQTRQASVPTNRTVGFLASRWLEYRNNDGRTSPNTLRGFRQSMNTWILDNPKFAHTSIQNIDIPTELGVTILCNWVDSLSGSPSSRLQQMSVLRSLLNDAISLGWIDHDLANPMNKPAILNKESAMKKDKERKKVNAFLTLPQVITLLSFNDTYMSDYKRMRYLITITCGLRDAEIQGLQWKDIDLSRGTIRVNKQLYKRGSLPILDYFETRKTHSAEQLEALPNAVTKEPKKDSERILPIPVIAIEALKHWKKVGWKVYTQFAPTEEAPVFPRSHTSLKPGEKAGDFCQPVASEGFQDDLVRADIPLVFEDAMGKKAPLTFHSLRHTYSHLLESIGAGDGLIGLLLGHKAKTVGREVYIPANISKWRETVDKLPLDAVSFRHRSIGKPPVLTLVKKEVG